MVQAATFHKTVVFFDEIMKVKFYLEVYAKMLKLFKRQSKSSRHLAFPNSCSIVNLHKRHCERKDEPSLLATPIPILRLARPLNRTIKLLRTPF